MLYADKFWAKFASSQIHFCTVTRQVPPLLLFLTLQSDDEEEDAIDGDDVDDIKREKLRRKETMQIVVPKVVLWINC